MFHIMVVEDDQALNRLICKVLKKNGCATVTGTCRIFRSRPCAGWAIKGSSAHEKTFLFPVVSDYFCLFLDQCEHIFSRSASCWEH